MATSKDKVTIQRSSIYYSEPDKIIVRKVSGKINIPDLNNPVIINRSMDGCISNCATCEGSCISHCDCHGACGCKCYCECGDSVLTDCSFISLPPEAAEKIIIELKLKGVKKLTILDDRYAQIVKILNTIQDTKPAKKTGLTKK